MRTDNKSKTDTNNASRNLLAKRIFEVVGWLTALMLLIYASHAVFARGKTVSVKGIVADRHHVRASAEEKLLFLTFREDFMRTVFFLTIVALLLFAPAALHAQTRTDEHKVEVGAFFTAIGVEISDESVNGIGGRFAYNFTKNFALDTEASFFPSDKLGNNQFGQKAQAFAGLRAGGRTRYVGAFAKARPGVMFLGDATSGFSCSTITSGRICRPSHNNFAFDAGGIVEFYPTRRSIIRVDAGDTIIRQGNVAGIGLFSPATSTTETTHNFQVSIGFGYRF